MSVGYITSEKPDYKVTVEEPVICFLNKEKKPGVLKFIGETKFSSGVWCGIALLEPCGKNDGSVAGVRYFECDEHHGIFVTPKNVFHDKAEDEMKPLEITPVIRDEEFPSITLDQQEHENSDCSFDESRPRSKSDAVINEKKNAASIFSNSPFKCNIRNAKSSSLSKLSNITYICSSPVLTDDDNKNLCEPRHSSPLVSSHISPDECDGTNNEHLSPGNVPNMLHHRSDLSPKFEVKKSIKLGSINSARFPAPAAALGKDQDSKLNKTFLVRTESLGVGKGELGNQASGTKSRSDVNETSGNNHNDELKQEAVLSSSNQENLNATFVSNNESDGENGRPRSVSKSPWSSTDSLSSLGSTKSNKERSRLNGTKTPRKLPCPTECSRSRLVKISAERKHTSKVIDKEIARNTRGQQVSKSASKPVANEVLGKKSRTKSTSVVVAPRSVLATPSASKSTMKQKSKSVSSDFRDGQPQRRTRLNSSKFATPLASKISALPSSRLTSTPLCKKTTLAERKSKLSTAGVNSQTTSSSSLADICENEPRRTSRENSNVETKLSSLPVKNKQSSSSMSVKKEKETKPASKVKNFTTTSSTTSKENKSLSAKTRALSTSAASKEYKAIAARGRNLSASCKEEIKGPMSKLRNMSTSRTEGGGITKTIGWKASIKSPAVFSVSEKLSTSSKSLPQPRKIKPGEQLSLKERQNSGELAKKRTVKEKPETIELRSCLSSAATPDILKQTPEIARHSIAVQVDTLHQEETTHKSTDEQRKEDPLLTAFVQRNREFEACLIALQVYAQKVDHECESTSLLRTNLKFTKERYYSTENMLVKESSRRAHLEEEMLSARSDTVVEVALLRAQYERKQEIVQTKMKEAHKKDLEKVRRQHVKSVEDVKHSCDLKLKRIEETYVEDIAELNEKHRDVIAELELQHSTHVDDLVEERHAEIEAIKEDYDEQMERFQANLSKSAKSCSKLEEKLRISEEEAKRDIELRIQDAIAKYKSLPDELESMKFVLEMKNNEVKKLRISNDVLQNKIDELMRIKDRAALLEREKESLNFVVENKGYLERQLSLERDKLRLSLNREVATSKRLSLEKEELAWRLNSFQNSPTSPTLSTDRFNWRLSGFNSPDSAVYSQKIEESDFEYEINDTKEIESRWQEANH